MATTFSPASRGLFYVQATISNTALTLDDLAGVTTPMVNAASSVLISVRTGSINFTTDGTTPTTSTGHAVAEGGSVQLVGPRVVSALKLIRNGASNATIDVTLEG